MVDFPEPDRPVRNSTNPRCARGGRARRSSRTTAGGVNHAGIPAPASSRSPSSPGDRSPCSVPASMRASGRQTSARGS